METILIDGKLYDSFYLIHTIEGQQILKKARDERKVINEPNVFCICRGMHSPVPMHAKKKPFSKNSYTLGANSNTKHLHSPECIRYLDEVEKEEKNTQEKTIKKSIDKVNGEKWETAYIFSNNYRVQEIDIKVVSKPEVKIERETTRSKYSSLYTMLEKITTFAWYKYVTNPNNTYNPKEGNLFHTIYTELNKMLILHPNIDNEKKDHIKIELGKLLFKPYKNIRNEDITKQLMTTRKQVINNKLESLKTLIIGKYLDHEIIDKGIVKIKMYDPYLKNHYYIYSTESQARQKLKEKVKGASLYVIAYVTPENDKPIVEVMDSMPVLIDRGIYVESTYEIEFAEELIKKELLFFRPPNSEYLFSHIFKRYIPDFIILNKETRRFSKICEVFGYRQDESSDISLDYWANADRKIEHYNTLKDRYDFYYWYPNEGENLELIKLQ